MPGVRCSFLPVSIEGLLEARLIFGSEDSSAGSSWDMRSLSSLFSNVSPSLPTESRDSRPCSISCDEDAATAFPLPLFPFAPRVLAATASSASLTSYKSSKGTLGGTGSAATGGEVFADFLTRGAGTEGAIFVRFGRGIVGAQAWYLRKIGNASSYRNYRILGCAVLSRLLMLKVVVVVVVVFGGTRRDPRDLSKDCFGGPSETTFKLHTSSPAKNTALSCTLRSFSTCTKHQVQYLDAALKFTSSANTLLCSSTIAFLRLYQLRFLLSRSMSLQVGEGLAFGILSRYFSLEIKDCWRFGMRSFE